MTNKATPARCPSDCISRGRISATISRICTLMGENRLSTTAPCKEHVSPAVRLKGVAGIRKERKHEFVK